MSQTRTARRNGTKSRRNRSASGRTLARKARRERKQAEEMALLKPETQASALPILSDEALHGADRIEYDPLFGDVLVFEMTEVFATA